MPKHRSMLLLCCLLIFAGFTGFAQINAGRLVGTVASSDGVVSGASITITDDQTGRQRQLASAADGTFSIPQLDVGTYTIKVTATGFKTYTAKEVKIDIGREYSLNIMLEIGAVQESVTISAGTDVLNATTAELSTTVSPRQVLELPLNGRNPLSLITLQAGAAPNRGNGSAIINGARTSSTNFVRDGINVQDIFIRNGFVPDTPTVDNTGEFTLITQNAGAEVGFGSSQVQLATPRGGQNYHGALWLYNRNSYFAANNYFNNAAGRYVATDAAVIQGRARVGEERAGRPFLNRNQFGGKFSGPIWLPHFGQGGPGVAKVDKAFFFFSYEKFLLRQQQIKNTTILRPDARNGIFSYRPTNPNAIQPGQCLTFTNGVCTINVLSGAGLTGAIPATSLGVLALDPTVQTRFLSTMPTAANRADLGDGLNTIGYSFNQSDPENRYEYTTRLDYELSSKHQLNGVYRFNKTVDARTDIDGSYNSTARANTSSPVKFMSLGWVSNYGRLSNDARGGFQFADVAFLNQVLPQQPFLVGGIPLALTSPEVNFRDQGRNTRTVVFTDNASLAWGKHTMRFGGDYANYKVLSFNQATVGIPTFNISTTANANTPRLTAGLFPGGISLADQNNADALRYFLGGVLGAGTIGANVTSRTSGYVPGAALDRRLKYDTVGLYVSDQWRIRPELTLNYGMRYEYYVPLRTADGLYLEPVLGNDATAGVLNPNGTYDFVGVNSGVEGRFIKPDRDNFGPTVSFAYTPQFKDGVLAKAFGSGKTVYRGGFRTSYVNDEYIRSVDNAVGQNAGLTAAVNAVQNGSPQLNARFGNALSVASLNPPAYITPPRTYAQNNTAAFGNAGTVFAVDPKLQLPRSYEYNFSIQREIGFQTAVELRYVGAHSSQMVRTIDFNQVDIRNNGFLADFNRAVSNERATRNGNTAGSIFGNATCLASGACQPLTVIPNLTTAGQNAVQAQITLGTPAETAFNLIGGANTGSVRFLANPNTGIANLVLNGGKFNYNALQTEIRRRFSNGLHLQANYTFQKNLTDVPDDGINQSRVAPYLDNQNQRLDYARASFDTTHSFNFNGIYELPFGAGKKLFNSGGWKDRVIGGWQVTSILQITSGTPLSFLDPRGTLNRAGRSANQTASSNLTKEQIKDLIGIRRDASGIVYFIDPSVILASGRASNGFGQATAANQVFFNVLPGQTGNVERLFINGPRFWNWDASAIKNIRITEGKRLQLRLEAFNVTNSTRFRTTAAGVAETNSGIFNINNTTFGRLPSAQAPRIVQFVGRLEF